MLPCLSEAELLKLLPRGMLVYRGHSVLQRAHFRQISPHQCKRQLYSERTLLTFNLLLQVYSQVGGVLRVELWDTNSPEDVLVNKLLVEKGYALKCDEPYMSTVRVLTVWWFICVRVSYLYVVVYLSSQLARCQALSMEHAKTQAAFKRRMEGRGEQQEEEVVPPSSTTTSVEWVSCHGCSAVTHHIWVLKWMMMPPICCLKYLTIPCTQLVFDL